MTGKGVGAASVSQFKLRKRARAKVPVDGVNMICRQRKERRKASTHRQPPLLRDTNAHEDVGSAVLDATKRERAWKRALIRISQLADDIQTTVLEGYVVNTIECAALCDLADIRFTRISADLSNEDTGLCNKRALSALRAVYAFSAVHHLREKEAENYMYRHWRDRRLECPYDDALDAQHEHVRSLCFVMYLVRQLLCEAHGLARLRSKEGGSTASATCTHLAHVDCSAKDRQALEHYRTSLPSRYLNVAEK